MDTVDDAKKGVDHEYVERLITEYFSQKLLKQVQDMSVRKPLAQLYEDEIANSASEEEDENLDEEIDDLDDQEEGGGNRFEKVIRRRERERQLKELKKWDFPSRIGSYNDYKNVALEYAKQLSYNVFGLDEAFFQTVWTLLRNMIAILHEKEFAPQVASGKEPSLILVIPDVICEYCQTSEDLDICRDPSLNVDGFDPGN